MASNFPNGFMSGLTVRGLPIQVTNPGEVFWVNNSSALAKGGIGGSDNNKGTYREPFGTIDYAIGKCTASRGDLIMVMPGHSEDPTTSITMDVAGVTIYGLGQGSLRPTVTFGATAAAVDITAANCTLMNIRFDLGSVAETVTNAINITGDGARVEGCETVVHATSQFTNHLTATDAQFVQIYNNKFMSLGAAGSTSGIVVDGCDDIEIVGNWVHGHFGEHALDNTTPASADEILRALIVGNYIVNVSSTAGDLAVELDAAATGMFAHNMIVGGLATTAANYDIGDLAPMESYVADSAGVDVHGIVLGTAAV